MRYLTLFAVVSLIVAVAWTNLRTPVALPVHVPAEISPGIEIDPAAATTVESDESAVPPVIIAPPVVIAAGDGPGALDVPVVEPVRHGDPATEADVPVSEDLPIVPVPPIPVVVSDAADAVEGRSVTDPEAVPDAVSTQPTPPIQRGRQLVGAITNTDGGAVPYVEILLTDLEGTLPTRHVRADASGIFVASGLQPGRYALAIAPRSVPLGIARPVALGRCRVGDEPPGFGAECVEILDTTTVTTADVVLPFASTVQGTIFGVDGSPAAGALVRALSRVERFERVNELVRTDDRGRFTLQLVPGPYELQVVAQDRESGGQLACSLRLEAEEGALMVLNAIDFSSPGTLPAVTSEPPVRVLVIADEEYVLWPIEAAAPASEFAAPVSGVFDEVTVEGRVMTRWGEPVEAVVVACFDADGDEVTRSVSDATGTFALVDVPAGRALIRVGLDGAPELDGAREFGAPEQERTVLSHVQSPLLVDVPGDRPRIVLKDIVVEVERVYRVAGRVEVDATTLARFQMRLIERDQLFASLSEARVRRAFLKGLRLTVRRVGERRGASRPVQIADDGTFHWRTALPASDVAFYLAPRSDRLGGVYPGQVAKAVTPVGVVRAEVVIVYPAAVQ